MVDKNHRLSKGLLIILSIIVVDQIIKFSIRHFEPSFDFWFLRVVFLQNTGIAFSFFTGYNVFLTLISLIFIALALYFNKYLIKEFGYYPFVFIIGGAISNVIDRIFLGYVIDMIEIWRFPVFNLADVMITLGAVLILWKYYNEEMVGKKPSKKKN